MMEMDFDRAREGSLQKSLGGFGFIMMPRGNALCLVNGYEYVRGCTSY